jgi:Kef-type K+ transport system membrane component KefB
VEHLGPAAVPFSMLVVFASAKLMAELFERLGQPGIVGEIVAGILIGPGVLAWMAPGEILDILSQLGALFLLFHVGLEVKASELMRVGGTALTVATAGVIVPFFLGWAISSLWGEPRIEAIFTGAAMVATSVGITARVLAANGLLQERASRIILAAAVIDDVLGLILLALVSGMAKGRVRYLDVAVTAGIAIGFTVFVALAGTRIARRVVPRVTATLKGAEAEFALAITVLFALSVVAVHAGVAAIVGAFLAGMALSESAGPRVLDLSGGVTELLVPFFLVGVGLHFDVSAFTQRSTLLLAVVIFIAAVLSKLVACGLGAIRLGRADALRVGVGMAPRGEVGMVVAQIGLGLGVMSESVYGIVVFMSVATTLVSPPLLRWAYRGLIGKRAAGEEMLRLG